MPHKSIIASRLPNFRFVVLTASLAILSAGAAQMIAPTLAYAQMSGHGSGGHGHGADGTGHDEVTMPGLRGLDASPKESQEIAILFRGFQTIDREVENLANGIRSVTYSSDADVMDALVSHVSDMITRVEEGRDPQIMIQSPTLDIFFLRGDGIETEIDVTDEGIIVVQTSDDPELVEALQVHAAEVTDMADRGMQAVHERMVQQYNN